MKHFRIFILVLMSILLPVRGAVAAAMLCPDEGGTKTTVVVAEHGHGHGHERGHDDMHAGHEMHVEHPASHHHASGDEANDKSSSGGHAATCQFCASGCCMAHMVGSVPSVRPPQSISSVTFPALTAPLPAFQSDGQDRPPRTI